MVNRCKIEIDRASSSGTFTNYDVIQGEVKLTVTSSISLSYIQVKLEGISRSQFNVTVENKRKREVKERPIQDVHKVLYETMIVFPPDNVRQVSLAKEFTLTPGNYSYPFEFKLPLNNSCVQVHGITNKVSFNKNSYDVLINNGNFNRKYIMNKTHRYYKDIMGEENPQIVKQQNYHIVNQLPPSLSGMGDFASVKYFVKVTCKRSSILKTNLRSYDPFIFLPLDMQSQYMNNVYGDYDEYREVFVRKEIVFRDAIPQVVAVKGSSRAKDQKPELQKVKALPSPPPSKILNFLNRFVSSPASPPMTQYPEIKGSYDGVHEVAIRARDVPFSFEVRFRHPAFLIPTKTPSFKVFLVSPVKPSRYTLAKYGKPNESNGLGIIYMQNLSVDLLATTRVSVLESLGSNNQIHKAKHEETITICNNRYDNLRFDLMNTKKHRTTSTSSTKVTPQDVYELEIPNKYYENCVLPDYLSPSFKTCNIQRKYNLKIKAGFTNEKIDVCNPSNASNILTAELELPDVDVLSGLSMTSTLHTNASEGTLSRTKRSTSQINSSEGSSSSHLDPPLLDTASISVGSSQMNSPQFNQGFLEKPYNLPTYDDVIRESSYQSNGEHYRARRRYQQHEQYYNNFD